MKKEVVEEEERVIKTSPGTLRGISTWRPYPGRVYFCDGDGACISIGLNVAMRPREIAGISSPGLEINTFFKTSIIMRYPKGAEIEVFAE